MAKPYTKSRPAAISSQSRFADISRGYLPPLGDAECVAWTDRLRAFVAISDSSSDLKTLVKAGTPLFVFQ